jgi:DNA-binding transcriptional LysR family regulator
MPPRHRDSTLSGKHSPSENAHRQVSIQLLVCLDALITERSVTRAAQRVGVSQPSMSNTLSRLRRLTRDALLVRTSRGMELTPRAQELKDALRRGLSALEEVFAEPGPFDPAGATGRVVVAAADFVGMMLLPRVMQAVGAAAPALQIDLRLPDPARVSQWLADGECDLAVGYLPQLSPELRVSTLFTEPLVCLVSAGHATIRGSISLDEYVRARHVVFGSPFSSTSTLETAIDASLAQVGLRRINGMQVASIVVGPYIVAQTDLVATLPRRLATHYAGFLPLAVLPAPIPLAEVAISMSWHDRTHRLGLHDWFRGVLRDAAAELPPG